MHLIHIATDWSEGQRSGFSISWHLITAYSINFRPCLAFCVQAFFLVTFLCGDRIGWRTAHAQNFSITCDTVLLKSDLDIPWDIEPLGMDMLLLTERTGKAYIFDIDSNEMSELHSFEDIALEGQGGLLGAAVHPHFPSSPELFFALTYYDADWNVLLRVERLQLEPNSLQVVESETVVDGIESGPSSIGGRIMVDDELKLWLCCGVADNNGLAQDLSSLNGKILRYHLDGSIPADNPYPASPVYTSGHRNPQGICKSPTGQVYISEHGAFTNDEINLIVSGGNHGWPLTSGPCTEVNQAICDEINMSEPLAWWTPNIAPSGITAFGGELMPEIGPGLLVSSLAGQSLRLFPFAGNGETLGEEVPLLNEWVGRIRDVAITPEGRVFFITSNTDLYGDPGIGDDKLYQVTFDVAMNMTQNRGEVNLQGWLTREGIFIEGVEPGVETTWELFNSMGQLVDRGNGHEAGKQESSAQLNPGVYILLIASGSFTSSKQYLILQ